MGKGITGTMKFFWIIWVFNIFRVFSGKWKRESKGRGLWFQTVLLQNVEDSQCTNATAQVERNTANEHAGRDAHLGMVQLLPRDISRKSEELEDDSEQIAEDVDESRRGSAHC